MSKTEYMNPEELAVEADTSVIPNYITNFVEQSMYIAVAAEADYNAMMESVGISELSIYEATGNEVVYEGVNFKELKDKFVEFFKKLWARIKGLYDSALKMIEKKKSEKIKGLNVSKSDLDKLTEDNYKAKEIYSYEGLADIDKISGYLKQNITKLQGEVEKYKNKPTDLDIDVIGTLTDGIVSASGDSIPEVVKSIKDKLVGNKVKADVAFLKANWDIIEATAGKPGAARSFKRDILTRNYKAEKEAIDKTIKIIKGFKEDEVEKLNKSVKDLKDIISGSRAIISAIMDVGKRREAEYFGLYIKVARSLKAFSGEEEVKNEATDPMIKLGTTQKDLIEASFDW